MHTALCTYTDRGAAEEARDRLLQAGFSRDDVHLEHHDRIPPGGGSYGEAARASGGVEHEIALDPSVVRRVTGFFGHLFGDAHPHRETYSRHVTDGRVVLVVDTRDQAEAERARSVLEGGRGEHLDVVHRPTQRPLRDLVADTPVQAGPQATGMQGRASGWTDRSDTTADAADRAVASGTPEQRELRFDGDRVNRDGWGRTRGE
ncbi:MAG: hypothetical protein EOO24_38540 [Comamonadaceae bacterium]|nr:MAG: hypothetical protein EOO24_38540 [Comamonadaceae bacterium]